MAQNILITGGAGYIGGSLIANFIARTDGPIKDATVTATVQMKEQVERLSNLGINVIQLDLNDEKAVVDAVINNQIDIVIHTAGAIVPGFALNLIKALGKRREDSGKKTYFVHSSVAAVFTKESGWPYGEIRDSDPIFEKEKAIGGPHPVRQINVKAVEEAKLHGVTFFNVVVPNIYGLGTGQIRKLSVNIPANIRSSIKHKMVYIFDKDGSPPTTHISDLTELYALLTTKILKKDHIPSGDKGYYFATAHRASWWDVMQRIAEGLHARGLVADPKPQTWPSNKMAAESLGWPLAYLEAMGTASGQLVAVNGYRLGWQPKWDEKRYLENIDDEIRFVLDYDTVKSRLFDTILDPKK